MLSPAAVEAKRVEYRARLNACLKEHGMAEDYCYMCYQSSRVCYEIVEAEDNAIGALTDPYTGVCPDSRREVRGPTDIVRPSFELGGGYTTSGGGSAILSFSIAPFGAATGIDRTNYSDASNMMRVDVTLRPGAHGWELDRAVVYGVAGEAMFGSGFGVASEIPKVTLDKARGQYNVDFTAKLLVSLLGDAASAYYAKRHLYLGAGARLDVRGFTVLAGDAGDPMTSFQVPVSVDAAYDLFEGRMKLGAFLEFAVNPARAKNYTAAARLEARYTV
ncbi:MAG: hypothetical protein HY075_02830, partial [Deltaproteobacteria bacterium]|nr:hypothetical protein [Deltaproteobacteria bacterium]